VCDLAAIQALAKRESDRPAKSIPGSIVKMRSVYLALLLRGRQPLLRERACKTESHEILVHFGLLARYCIPSVKGTFLTASARPPSSPPRRDTSALDLSQVRRGTVRFGSLQVGEPSGRAARNAGVVPTGFELAVAKSLDFGQ
jgi:hypothetical protein